jgi:hypothetical protein
MCGSLARIRSHGVIFGTVRGCDTNIQLILNPTAANYRFQRMADAIDYFYRAINSFDYLLRRKGQMCVWHCPRLSISALQLGSVLLTPEIGKCVRFPTLILGLKCLCDVCLECMQVILAREDGRMNLADCALDMHLCRRMSLTLRHGVLPVPVSGERNWSDAIGRFCGFEGEWGVCAEEVKEEDRRWNRRLGLAKAKKIRGDGIV